MTVLEKKFKHIEDECRKHRELSVGCVIGCIRKGYCYSDPCYDDCEICNQASIAWLLSDICPNDSRDLLVNGDGLSYGQTIQVYSRELGVWVKRKFLCYENGLFWCFTGIEEHYSAHPFERAMLPDKD